MKKTYSIGDVCRMTGLTEKQLRYWEKKGFIPEPARIVCGKRAYRRYDEDLVELIIKMKELIDDGYTVSASAKHAQAILSGDQMGGDDDAQ